MKWYKHLYVGNSLIGKVHKIKWKINHNAGTVSVYVIALASNPDNLIDIIPARELLQKAYPKDDMFIVGIAKGYDEAIGVVQRIIDETYLMTKTVNVAQYLKENRRKSL